MVEDKIYSSKEAAEFIGVSIRTFKTMKKQGKVTPDIIDGQKEFYYESNLMPFKKIAPVKSIVAPVQNTNCTGEDEKIAPVSKYNCTGINDTGIKTNDVTPVSRESCTGEAEIAPVQNTNCTGEDEKIAPVQNTNCTGEDEKIAPVSNSKKFAPYSNDFIERIKGYTAQIADALLEHSKDGGFICPACGNGSRDSGTGIKFDGEVAHCFACNASFNIFQAIQKKYNLNFPESVKACADTIGLTAEFDSAAPSTKLTKINKPAQIKKIEKAEKPQQDLTDYYTHCHKNINDPKVQEYLKERGLDNLALINIFNIGYDPDCNCLVIPHNQYFCTRRYLKTWTDEKGKEHRYKYVTGSKTALFNADFGGDFLFVVEGAINALSIIKACGDAVAIGGAGNGNLLIEALQNVDKKPVLILLLDEDKPGQDKADELLKNLYKLNILAIKAHLPIYPETNQDINDLLRSDEEALKKFVANTIELAKKIRNRLKDWTPPKPARLEITYESEDRNIFLPQLNLELTLPESYSMSKDGILEYSWNAKKKEFDINLVSYSPIVISKLIDNIDNNLAKCELSCYDDVNKKWRKIVDDNSVIFNSGSIISLAKRHLDVTSETSKRLVKFLAKFKTMNKGKIPNSESINNIGWRNGEFLPVSNKSKYELDDTIKADFIEKFQSSGDRKEVISLIKDVKNFDIANMIIGTTIAAPLRRIAFDHNIAAHLGGITGSGKTAINTLAYSLFYSTKVEIPRFNGTRNGFEKIFAGMRDLPVFIDDANNLADNERKQAEKMIYDFVNGVGRIRTNKNLDTVKPSTFYGSLLTSGEHFLTTSNSAGGAKTREMEFNVGKSFIPKEIAIKIYKTTKKHYGLFLTDWIDFIKARENEIKDTYEIIRYGGKLLDIEIEGFHNTYEGKIPRHIDNIAAITTSNIFFDLRFLKEEEAPLKEWIQKELDCAKRVFEMLPDYAQILDYKRAIPIIRDWIISRPKFFIQAGKYENANGEGDFELTAEGFNTFGVIRKSYVAINPTVFENFMIEQGFSSLTINQLADDGFIIRNGRHLKTPILNYPSKGKQTLMYKISLKNIYDEMEN